jgi:hypothetical protein
MRWHARRLLPVGLGVSLVLAGVGAAALWIRAVPGTSHPRPVHTVSRAEEPALGLTPQAVESRRAEAARVHAGLEQLQRRSAAMSRELAALRSQRPGVD